MLLSQTDVLMPLHPRAEWKKARTKDELVALMEEELKKIPGVSISFTQPIKMRMMELIEGVGIRGDVGVKLFGPDREVRQQYAERIGKHRALGQGSRRREGGDDRGVAAPRHPDQARRDRASRHQRGRRAGPDRNGAGRKAGVRRLSMAISVSHLLSGWPPFSGRMRKRSGAWCVHTSGGEDAPLAELADIVSTEGPVQLSRENGEGRTVVQANVRGRDLGSVVKELQEKVETRVKLPAGYHVEYGGTYEKMQSGRARLMIVVPVTFAIISCSCLRPSARSARPRWSLPASRLPSPAEFLRSIFAGMHFSMSAGIGFIALFGVAVLNGVVLVTFINELRRAGALGERGHSSRVHHPAATGVDDRNSREHRLHPDGARHGAGAEVQKPLATVVIGGLISSTLLTLLILPALYRMMERDSERTAEPPSPTQKTTEMVIA